MKVLVKRILLIILLMPFIVACVTNDNKYGQLVDENSSWSLYLSTDEPAKDEFSLPVVSLWARNKETGDVHKVMTSNPDARITCQYDTISHIVPVDCIRAVFMARIISLPKDPLKLLIEGCPDFRNVDSFIYEEKQSTAIHLPTSGRCLGLSDEEGLIIMQSYMYYQQGCRYNVISAFDENGQLLASMSPKLYPALDKIEE